MIYVATRAGKHHEKSEDTVLVGELILANEEDTLPIPKEGFVCVADGVGGNQGGACASSFVPENILSIASPIDAETLKEELIRINDLLIHEGTADMNLSSMATTLTGLFLRDNERFLIHVGNTRAYTKQGRYLKQITQDHTVYNWLQKTGRFEEAEACNKNEITNCFGGGNASLLSKLYVIEIGDFTQILLTSDGVHEYVDIDLLEDILNDESSGEDKCNSILDAALVAGSDDDMTAIFVCAKEE